MFRPFLPDCTTNVHTIKKMAFDFKKYTGGKTGEFV
jgi:hypothetical protein